jgi:hypothetical protein
MAADKPPRPAPTISMRSLKCVSGMSTVREYLLMLQDYHRRYDVYKAIKPMQTWSVGRPGTCLALCNDCVPSSCGASGVRNSTVGFSDGPGRVALLTPDPIQQHISPPPPREIDTANFSNTFDHSLIPLHVFQHGREERDPA